jgi:hypothetical protein
MYTSSTATPVMMMMMIQQYNCAAGAKIPLPPLPHKTHTISKRMNLEKID